MKFKKLTIVVSLTLIVALFVGCTRNLDKIEHSNSDLIVGLDETFVPMGFRDRDGKLKGFDIDLAKEVERKIHRRIIFQPIDWDLKETELKNGTIDLIWNGYSKTPNREREVDFSIPYLRNSQDLIMLKTKNSSSDVSAMQGKILGMQNGSSGQTVFEGFPQILKDKVSDIVLYDNFNNAFLDLNSHRINGVLGDSIYLDYYRNKQKNPDAYQIINANYPSETFAIGLRKNNPHLKEELNQALVELRKEGVIRRLSEKWFNQDLSFTPKM